MKKTHTQMLKNGGFPVRAFLLSNGEMVRECATTCRLFWLTDLQNQEVQAGAWMAVGSFLGGGVDLHKIRGAA